MGVLGDSIGNAAHFAGFLIGLLMVLWDNRHQLSRQSWAKINMIFLTLGDTCEANTTA